MQVFSLEDENCRWSTAPRPSLRGTAFLGAWTRIIVRGSDTLTFEADEQLSTIQILKWRRFKAIASINLRQYAEDAELGGGSTELVLTLLPARGRKIKDIEDEARLAAEEENGAEEGITPEHSAHSGSSFDQEEGHKEGYPSVSSETFQSPFSNHSISTKLSSQREGSLQESPRGSLQKMERAYSGPSAHSMPTSDQEDKLTARPQASSQQILPEPTDRKLIRSTVRLSMFKLVLLRLRMTLRVVPLSVWEAEQHAYESRGAVLEMKIKSLPRLMHSYAHGGFMGLACSIGEDPEWSSILEKEDPGAWKTLQL